MATVTEIRSVCPKCGKEGTQNVFSPKKSRPELKYLRFIHSHGESCFIGRVSSGDEFMGEMNKPETKEEYQAALNDVVKEIRQLIGIFAIQKSGSAKKITRSLREILTKYGY